MKAIIVLFNASYAVGGEENLTRDIANSLYENTNLETADEQTVRVHTLDDREVASLFVKPFLTVETKSKTEDESKNIKFGLEQFCQAISRRCGKATGTKTEIYMFKRKFFKLLMEESKFREDPIVAFLIGKGKLTAELTLILKKYDLEPIREYLREINNMLSYF